MKDSSNLQISKSQNFTRRSFSEGGPQILVTGIGAISAAGNDISANFANMTSGHRNYKSSPSLFECEIQKPLFECDSQILDRQYLPYQRTLALALKAVYEALDDAKLSEDKLKELRVGVCLGTSVACTLNSLDFYSHIRSGEDTDIEPLRRYIEGEISEAISARFALSGPVISIANACASGTNAIEIGYSWIESNECDIVIAGGADELNLIPYCGFNSLQVMSDEPCLPFDPGRKGLNLGEGAGILILESENSANQRNIESEIILATCSGASDAYHLTGPHPEGEGLLSSIQHGLTTAGIKAEDIDYINAHGTATRDNDKTESLVFSKLSKAKEIPFSSTKYYTGHTLGAAGAIEAAICVKGMREGYFPGQPGIKKDPELPLSPQTENIRYNGNAVLSTSMAFGGSCASLIFTKRQKSHEQKDVYSSKNIKISSIGIVGPFGRGIDKFKASLNQTADANSDKFKLIPEEAINDPELKRTRRRADKLSLAMLSAAKDAILSLDLQDEELKRCAVVAVTALGAHNTTFKFLDGVLDFGHTAPSPTHFSNSVHNAPSFYITSFLKITGLSVTMTGFKNPFKQALNYADSLLNNGSFERVLLVAGDEIGEAMLKMSEMWYTSQGKQNPAWGEGAVAFVLEKSEESNFAISCDENPKIEKLFGKTLVNEAFEFAANLLECGGLTPL